jgi:hypothetical protein
MSQLIDLTQPDVMKSDQKLMLLLRDLYDAGAGDLWVTDVEDFLIEQDTEQLLALARRLLQVLPSQVDPRVFKALKTVLELRPGCAEIAGQLPSEYIRPSESDLKRWYANRVTEMVLALANSKPAEVQTVLDDVGWNWGNGQKFFRSAFGDLSQQQLQLVDAKLRAHPSDQAWHSRLLKQVEEALAEIPPPPDTPHPDDVV